MVATPEGPVDQISRIAEEGASRQPRERQMWNRELQAQVRIRTGKLEGLTLPRERYCVSELLGHYEGLRLRAIGDILGTTEEAAKNCLFRATQKMRASLEIYV